MKGQATPYNDHESYLDITMQSHFLTITFKYLGQVFAYHNKCLARRQK